ncbi:hypothetical protein [Streptomyces sp. NPDC006463]|uniref:hypothetical protein n=1 Tax=Streptomyces sp. NPDC006463 TaxID=3364746 RepID=UPI00368B4C57
MAGSAEWFMDYRNAGGSLGVMCGNGIRVLARYLTAPWRRRQPGAARVGSGLLCLRSVFRRAGSAGRLPEGLGGLEGSGEAPPGGATVP